MTHRTDNYTVEQVMHITGFSYSTLNHLLDAHEFPRWKNRSDGGWAYHELKEYLDAKLERLENTHGRG